MFTRHQHAEIGDQTAMYRRSRNTRTPDPAAIHAKAIAQAVEVIISHIDGRDYLATSADEAGDSSGASIHRYMLHALNEARVAIRSLSPDPDLIVVRREQLEAWINEIDRWGRYSEYKGMGRIDEDTMIAEMRALLGQPTGGEDA